MWAAEYEGLKMSGTACLQRVMQSLLNLQRDWSRDPIDPLLLERVSKFFDRKLKKAKDALADDAERIVTETFEAIMRRHDHEEVQMETDLEQTRISLEQTTSELAGSKSEITKLVSKQQ